MNVSEILRHLDHTNLQQTATWEDIRNLCDDAVKYNTASICIPPSYVRQASEYLQGKKPVCTVIGFPHGYNTTACKEFEAREAIANGASEVDMVINLGWVKDGLFGKVQEEIETLRRASAGHVLKVIIETGLLTDEEKVKMCQIVTDAKADYIKTCTGYAEGRATAHDIDLFKKNLGPEVKMKASSGMTTLEEGAAFVAQGCDRLGSRLLLSLAKEQGC